MKKIICCLGLIAAVLYSSAQAEKLHFKSVVADTHNDALSSSSMKGLALDADLNGKTHSDINRFIKGGIDIQIFSIFCDGDQTNPFLFALKEMDSLDAVIGRNSNRAMLAYTYKDIKKGLKENKFIAMKGVEGGHMIEDKISNLDSLYKRGARYMTLTWNNSTSWATSAKDETENKIPGLKKGLNDFGKQIVKRMNELGMMVDLSHVGEQTFWDAINTTAKPIIVSHSCVYNICPHRRNLKDDQIKAVGKNGGVICVNFYSGFLDSNYNRRKEAMINLHKTVTDSLKKLKITDSGIDDFMAKNYPQEVNELRAPFSLLLDHIDYIVKMIGADHVGLGSDFDGIESPPQHLNGVQDYPLITKGLLERGYSKKDIKKILGENFLRVYKANAVN
ncbi:MAG: dipeptidase [Ferruginibacter sp.]